MARLSFNIAAAILAILPQVHSTGCNADNVLRALRRYSTEAVPFCATFIQQTSTVTVTPSSQATSLVYVTQTITASTKTDLSLSTVTSTSTFTKYLTETESASVTQVQHYTETVPTLTITTTTSNSYGLGGGLAANYNKREALQSLPTYVSQYPASRVSSACSCLDGVATSTVTATATGSTKLLTTTISVNTELDLTVTTTTTLVVTVGAVQTVESSLEVTVTQTLSSSTLTTLALATETVVCGACVSGNQVVQNAGFEEVDSSGGPLVWTTYAQQYTYISDVTSNAAVNGNHLMLAAETDTSPSYPRVILAQFLAVCPSARYTLSFYAGIYNPNGGSVTSQVEVQLAGSVIVAKTAPCSSGTGGNCSPVTGYPGYYWRKITATGIAPTSCNPELVFRVYFTKTTQTVAKIPRAIIDVVRFTQE